MTEYDEHLYDERQSYLWTLTGLEESIREANIHLTAALSLARRLREMSPGEYTADIRKRIEEANTFADLPAAKTPTLIGELTKLENSIPKEGE
jgi:hypothetical protein